MITSSNNSQVKEICQLQKKSKLRNKEGVFIVEGPKMFEELPKDRLISTFVSETFVQERPELLRGVRYEVAADNIFAQMSDTQTPQGILAVAKQYTYTLEDILKNPKTPQLLILENIQDPGNLGTMLRTAEGAGTTGIIMTRGTVDIYNPKVIRSTMGSLYRMPFLYAENLEETIAEVKAAGVSLYAAHLKGVQSYDEPDYKSAVGFLIGNEANGLTTATANMADCRIRIPMEGQLESLNAAVSAALLMYEAHRQRRA